MERFIFLLIPIISTFGQLSDEELEQLDKDLGSVLGEQPENVIKNVANTSSDTSFNGLDPSFALSPLNSSFNIFDSSFTPSPLNSSFSFFNPSIAQQSLKSSLNFFNSSFQLPTLNESLTFSRDDLNLLRSTDTDFLNLGIENVSLSDLSTDYYSSIFNVSTLIVKSQGIQGALSNGLGLVFTLDQEKKMKDKIVSFGKISNENLSIKKTNLRNVMGNKEFLDFILMNRLRNMHNLWFSSKLSTFQLEKYFKLLRLAVHDKRKVIFLKEKSEGTINGNGFYTIVKKCSQNIDCGSDEICYSNSYCAAFCDSGLGLGCSAGFQCVIGLCVLQHQGFIIENENEVYPCLENLECPLNMVCNKVNCDLYD